MNDNYFKQFIKTSISDLKTNGICYAYNKEQVKEIKKRVKKELVIVEAEYGYAITIKR